MNRRQFIRRAGLGGLAMGLGDLLRSQRLALWLLAASLVLVPCAGMAQSFQSLYSFSMQSGAPSGLTLANDGNLYGTTQEGGVNNSYFGNVIRVTTGVMGGGVVTALNWIDYSVGAGPYPSLIQATDGNLYGVTPYGGISSAQAGTVYRIAMPDALGDVPVPIFWFDGFDGYGASARLLLASDGYLYGTTTGGDLFSLGYSATVFRISLSGQNYTELCDFINPVNGTNYPSAGLIQATDGYLYGTTLGGGQYGFGSVFRIPTGGAPITPTTLYSFLNMSDGASPVGNLIQASDHNLYGMTSGWDNSSPTGYGTVFRIATDGTPPTTLHTFNLMDLSELAFPEGGLVQAADGYLYGTTPLGGRYGMGTAFRISTSGDFTTLHEFDGTDGWYPLGTLVQAPDGYLYGTTSLGGTYYNAQTQASGFGTVFRIGTGPATDGATFVSQTVPTAMTAGHTYSVSVTMQNSGGTTWTASSYQNGAQNPQDNSTWGVDRAALPQTTAPGQQVTFTFNVTAPSTAGTYNFQRKMIHAGVGWFGALSPNVVVTVSSGGGGTDGASFVSQTVPTTMTAGQTYSVSVTMQNSGTSTWTTASYQNGSQNPQDNSTWGVDRVALPSSVAPGAQVTFTFNVTAPSRAGTYNFQRKMVHAGVGWFGALSTNVAVTVTAGGGSGTDGATFVSQTVPTTMTHGQTYQVTVVMRNSGTSTWTTASYQNGAQDPQDNTTWAVDRVALPASTAPGAQATFTFNVTAPTTPGTYHFQRRMVHLGVGWFGDFSPVETVTVH